VAETNFMNMQDILAEDSRDRYTSMLQYERLCYIVAESNFMDMSQFYKVTDFSVNMVRVIGIKLFVIQ
jgi:hypothetical protein